jgi:hypothetical protein
MYLTRAEAVLDFDLPSTWASHRAVCFTFAELYAEIAAVLGPSEGSVARVRPAQRVISSKTNPYRFDLSLDSLPTI